MYDRGAVSWPTSEDGETVFDLGWLDRGTTKPMSPDEERAIQYVFDGGDLYAQHVTSRVRTECYRRRAIHRFGRNFLHQPPSHLRAGDVRGVFYLEWDAHIAHMQRTGHLDEALSLTYEAIDAAERLNSLDGMANPAGWYVRAAVLLRKMKDYGAEVRLLEDCLRHHPGRSHVAKRLAAAVALSDRSR